MQAILELSKAHDFEVLKKLRFGSQTLTLTGTFTMNSGMPVVNFLDPGGAGRTVLLPAEERGLCYVFVNTADAAEVLTIKDDSGTTTFATPTQAESALVFCNGVTWGGLVGAAS